MFNFQASFSDEFGSSHRGAKQDTQFYEDGVWELTKLRAILCGSYVYGYYVEDEKTRIVFESLQTELEEATERLAEVIARFSQTTIMFIDSKICSSLRPYLRTPQKTIMQILKHCRRKRQEFTKASNSNFHPPDDEEVATRFSPAGVVPPHLDKNLTDVEKIYAIYDWMAYNERKQDNAQENPGSPAKHCQSIGIHLIFVQKVRWKFVQAWSPLLG